MQTPGHTATVVNYAARVVIYDCNMFIVQAIGGKISDWKTIRTSSKGASTFSTATLRITELSITIKMENSHKLAQQSNTQNNITQHNNKNGELTQ